MVTHKCDVKRQNTKDGVNSSELSKWTRLDKGGTEVMPVNCGTSDKDDNENCVMCRKKYCTLNQYMYVVKIWMERKKEYVSRM